ncbi:MAG: endonuclease/exonuclease/phosphatase family protein [Chloroflexi bacterium]|nr:endonuclease/exonuclease/phosphatase family protein [Chloroflexota bacterium]
MKVLVWNVRRANDKRNDIWDYFLEIAPDIALLQEVGSLPSTISSCYSTLQRNAYAGNGKNQKFHTSVLVKGSINYSLNFTTQWAWVNEELQNYAGNIVPAQISLTSGDVFRAVSVYSPAWPIFDRKKLKEIDAKAIQLENNPDIWVTEILWAALMNENLTDTSWIVAGDFNSSVTFDTMWKGGPHGNQEIQDRMVALGLTECLALFQGKITPTFRNTSNKKVIHQMDHLFVSKKMAERLTSCTTGDANRVFDGSMSDHLPIIAEF